MEVGLKRPKLRLFPQPYNLLKNFLILKFNINIYSNKCFKFFPINTVRITILTRT
jgi:hypothetical protein